MYYRHKIDKMREILAFFYNIYCLHTYCSVISTYTKLGKVYTILSENTSTGFVCKDETFLS